MPDAFAPDAPAAPAAAQRILVAFASNYGQTAKIVVRLSEVLTAHGLTVTLWKADSADPPKPLDQYGGFLIAGSVYLGKHQRTLVDFVRRHVATLNRHPSAFISVCGALAGNWEPGQLEARKYLVEFLHQTGWSPKRTISFAGAIPYTQYGWLTRLVMKRISRKTGRPTDTTRDWEFTDWAEVDRFGRELAAMFSPEPRASKAGIAG